MIRKQFFTTEKRTYLIGSVFVTHEFDAAGCHRLVIDSKVSASRGYLGIVKLTVPEGTFCGTSEYYEHVFPRVFQVVSGHGVKAMEG